MQHPKLQFRFKSVFRKNVLSAAFGFWFENCHSASRECPVFVLEVDFTAIDINASNVEVSYKHKKGVRVNYSTSMQN